MFKTTYKTKHLNSQVGRLIWVMGTVVTLFFLFGITHAAHASFDLSIERDYCSGNNEGIELNLHVEGDDNTDTFYVYYRHPEHNDGRWISKGTAFGTSPGDHAQRYSTNSGFQYWRVVGYRDGSGGQVYTGSDTTSGSVDPCSISPPDVNLSADDSSIGYGETVTLSWTVGGGQADSCTASRDWSGSKSTLGSFENVGPLNEDSEFELTCTGEGGSDSDVVFVSVAGPNTQPNASDDSYTNRQCGSTYNFYVLGNDYDPDGDAINVNRVYSSSDGVSPSNRTSYIRYTVPSDFDGFDYFRYRIVDEHGAYDSGSYAYVWLSGDSCQKEDPVAVNDSVSMRCGDTKYINVVSNDYDPDGGDVDLISVGSASHGSASRYNDTYARYSAPDEYSGSDSFSYTIEDDEGATDTGSVSVSIACEATSVDIDASPSTIAYGGSTTVSWTVSGDVDWCSASGTTGDWSGYKSTSGGSENVGPIWREGNVRATLTCDGPGGRKADTVWITVLEPSNPPSVSLSVSPSSVGYGDPSTLSWTASGEVDSCTATGDWSGSKSTSDSESTGSQYDDSSYTLSCTGPGGSGSDTEEVDVGAQNQSPTANFSYSTDGLDVDFTDQSSDSDGSITAHSWNFGDEGTSSATNPSHDYSSAGTYSVTLTVTDNDGATDSHTEDVSVDQPNRSPHAEGDSESVWENSSNNPLSVLSNDSDPDGDSLDVSRIISQPSHGTVSISGDDILYTPDNGYTGSDSFSYRATDGSLESNTAQVSITVQAAEDYSMQLSPSSVELSENTSGTSDTVTITIVRINGFDGTVNLSIDSGGTSPELSGAGYNFSDSTLTGSETQSTLVVTVSNPLDPGTYTVRVQASSSELGNRYRSFDINVDSSIDPEYEEF